MKKDNNIKLASDNISWITYPGGRVKQLKTIWKAKLPHNAVSDMPEYDPETCYGRDSEDCCPEDSPAEFTN